jgi:hypothetical protein
MTMLTHAGGQFKPARYSSGARDTAGTGATNAHLAMIQRFCMCALTILMAGGAVAGIIALKTAIALSRLGY